MAAVLYAALLFAVPAQNGSPLLRIPEPDAGLGTEPTASSDVDEGE